MARPPRIEFPGAIYLVSSHRPKAAPGAPVAPAFADDADRSAFLALLAHAMQRFDGQVLAFCLLADGFELLLFTRQANLSRLMRHLNGVYTQYHHRHHHRPGVLFQGRFKALLVDREARLLDACRHVELGALRSGLVPSAQALADWPWSSYPAHAGLAAAPAWLDVDGLHGHLLGHLATTPAQHRKAAAAYVKLQTLSRVADLLSAHLRQQLFIGDAAFAARVLARHGEHLNGASSAAKPARKPRSWPDWQRDSSSREQALYRAYIEGGLPMSALAANLGLSVSRISRLIAVYEQGLQ